MLLAVLFVMEGAAARTAGQAADENPYEPDTSQHKHWLEGWRDPQTALDRLQVASPQASASGPR